MLVVVEVAEAAAPESVGTPVVVKVEMDVPAMSCDSDADVVAVAWAWVELLTGGNDVERATVLRIGFSVPKVAVA